MNDINNSRPFIAKTQLYHDIARLPRPFLRRNLNHIFDTHEKLLRGHINVPETIAEEDIRRRARWKPPTKAMMDLYCDQEEAKLTIDSFLLRPHGQSYTTRENGQVHTMGVRPARLNRRPPRNDGPDWLPHPDDRPTRCQVAISIHPKESTRTLYSECRSGEIHTLEGASNMPEYELHLRSPFVIMANQLNIPSGQGEQWEQLMADKYTLEIAISCQTSRDAAELLAELEGRIPADYAFKSPSDGTIKALWGKPSSNDPGLPAIPSEGRLLRLKRSSGHKSLDLPYGLQPSMSWNTRPGPSVLAQHNSNVRRLRLAQQVPTPSPSEDAEPRPRKRRGQSSVRYQFWNGAFVHKSVHMAELRCIFCPNEPQMSNIERLYSHYAVNHDHFSIVVEEDDKDCNVRVFKMELKEESQDLLIEKPKDNFDWTAPKAAFDAVQYMDEHSRGERSRWETQPSEPVAYVGESRASGKMFAPKGRRGRPMAPVPSAIELDRTKTKNMPAKDVPDLPIMERKRHTVPHVPGIDFYRTTSKHVLSPGDLISDSDDEPDEFWLVERQRHDLNQMGIDRITQKFHILINNYMDQERPMSDILVRDSIVRLARLHREELADPTMSSLFRQKLMILSRGRAISNKDMDYCLELIADAALDCDVEMGGTELEEPSVCKSGSAASNSKSKLSQAHFGHFALLTPRGTADSSPQPSMQAKVTPFGRRTYICRRTSGSRVQPYHGDIEELVKSIETDIGIDDITPRHLCWTKFRSFLDEKLVYIRDADHIVCISNRLAALVTDEKDWYEALEQAAEVDGTVIFELHSGDSYQNLLAENSSSPQRSKLNGKMMDVQEMASKLAGTRLAKPPCDCSETVRSTRGAIACGNPTCLRDFHMACVGLQRRPMDWKCPGCSS